MRFVLEDGLQIVARGKVTLYEARGDCQIVLDSVEPKGLGALQLAFEQLKASLAGEGLFDSERKRPLPVFPRSVGIVTSMSGAVLHDILTVLQRRCPILSIVIVPVQVQGDGSARQIAEAIRSLNAGGRVDVLILGRGGGSLEDLWSFNEEIVVRAIAASRIPVVSAVGHETDVTLADLAADVRAPTPSAAAEAVAPVLEDFVSRLLEWRDRCRHAIDRRCDGERQRLKLSLSDLSRLRVRVQKEAQRVDFAMFAMSQAVHAALRQGWTRVADMKEGLLRRNPDLLVRHGLAVLPQLVNRLCQFMRHRLDQSRQLAESRLAELNHLSPLAVLNRGYSIVQTSPGHRLVRDARQVSVGDDVLAWLAKGRLLCVVKQAGVEADFKSTSDTL
jgi:exodeoxyribonuclease VII large subunit